jgi:hypothetical protein
LDPDLDPWIHFSECPDQDPAIFVIELQDANKKLIFVRKFLLLFEGTCTAFSKIKSQKEVTKQ